MWEQDAVSEGRPFMDMTLKSGIDPLVSPTVCVCAVISVPPKRMAKTQKLLPWLPLTLMILRVSFCSSFLLNSSNLDVIGVLTYFVFLQRETRSTRWP